LLSCNDTQPATDETTGGDPSDSTPVEETTPSIEELTDPEKSREVQFTTEYSYRFGEKYFIRRSSNADSQPVREQYFLFESMKLDFTLIYSYDKEGKMIYGKLDRNDQTMPDETFSFIYDGEKVSRFSHFRAGAKEPCFEIAYSYRDDGTLQKENVYKYGNELTVIDYDDKGVKIKERGRVSTEFGVYELEFTSNEIGSTASVTAVGKNYKEVLNFVYTDNNLSYPSDIEAEIYTAKMWHFGYPRDVIIEYDDNNNIKFFRSEIKKEVGVVYKYIYDENGAQYLQADSESRNMATEYEYDENFVVKKISGYDSSRHESYTHSFAFDEKGFMTRHFITAKNTLSGSVRTVMQENYEYELDEFGNVIKIVTAKASSTSVTEYDNRGNKVKEGSDTNYIEFFYNENGVLYKEMQYFEDSTVVTRMIEYTDDAEISHATLRDKDGNILSESISTFTRAEDGLYRPTIEYIKK
jgi:hypothetical protein